MIWHLYLAEDEHGQRVGEGIGIHGRRRQAPEAAGDPGLSEAEQQRLDNLGNNGPRDVTGKVMTHCVPNERVRLASDESAERQSKRHAIASSTAAP